MPGGRSGGCGRGGPMIGIYTAIARGGCGIASVYPNSPAAGAGLKRGDVITHVDDQRVLGFRDMASAFAGKDPGDQVIVVFRRGAQTIRKTIRLMRRK